MLRLLVFTLWFSPLLIVTVNAAPRLNALLFPDRTAAVLLIAALFYCGFKWRAR